MLTGVFLLSIVAEHHSVLTLVRLLARAVQTAALARHSLVLLGAACLGSGSAPTCSAADFRVQQSTMTGPSLMLVRAGVLAKTARGSS